MKTLLLYLSLLLTPLVLLATSAHAAPENARSLVHLLDYLASDYGGAVQHGKVISKSEYAEQMEFAEKVETLSKLVAKEFAAKDVEAQAKTLQSAIHSKAEAATVATLARAIQARVVAVSKLEQAPPHWPSRKHGGKLFAENCVTCHGATGHGDGPAGVALKPPPADFFDAERFNQRSPFQIFNAIRIGIPGTGMAPWEKFSDDDIWDLAFYLSGLRHEKEKAGEAAYDEATLKKASIQSDNAFVGPRETLIAIRLHEEKEDSGSFLRFAGASIDDAGRDYDKGDTDNARIKALAAYLQGVEPVEPKLKATDPHFTIALEEKMAAVRSAIESKAGSQAVHARIEEAHAALNQANTIVTQTASSPAVVFALAAGILLREGFEAVLLLIALLGVIRAAKSRKAELWLHGGWVAACLVGLIAWFSSSWVENISGASRELMEGSLSLFAVAVLLYIGFWLHSKTEIGRWKAFIDGKVQKALDGGNLFGIAMISFVAVFREAFECVLFLRAISLESAGTGSYALGAGVAGAFIAVLAIAWAMLKWSAKIPIRKLFTVSSILMIALAVILTGKALHSFQETGILSATGSPVNFRFDFIGFFPTVETTIAQIAMLAFATLLWQLGKKQST